LKRGTQKYCKNNSCERKKQTKFKKEKGSQFDCRDTFTGRSIKAKVAAAEKREKIAIAEMSNLKVLSDDIFASIPNILKFVKNTFGVSIPENAARSWCKVNDVSAKQKGRPQGMSEEMQINIAKAALRADQDPETLQGECIRVGCSHRVRKIL